MKLKGRFAKRLKGEDKKKKEATLKRMAETREQDNVNLRETLVKKLAWAEAEKKKGIDNIEKIRANVLRLDGAIIVIKSILSPEKKETK